MKASCIVFRIREFDVIKEVILMTSTREICEALVAQVLKEAQYNIDTHEERNLPTFEFISKKSNGYKKILEQNTFYNWEFSFAILRGLNPPKDFCVSDELEIGIKDLVCYDENTLPKSIKSKLGIK